MLVRFGKFLVIVALVSALGAHWALLQTVAWTTMLANNLCTHSISEAVTDTFDGKHLCPLCKAIAAGKKTEHKAELSFQTQKLEFPPAPEHFVLVAPTQFQLLPHANTFAESLMHPPLTPPPRTLFA